MGGCQSESALGGPITGVVLCDRPFTQFAFRNHIASGPSATIDGTESDKADNLSEKYEVAFDYEGKTAVWRGGCQRPHGEITESSEEPHWVYQRENFDHIKSTRSSPSESSKVGKTESFCFPHPDAPTFEDLFFTRALPLAGSEYSNNGHHRYAQKYILGRNEARYWHPSIPEAAPQLRNGVDSKSTTGATETQSEEPQKASGGITSTAGETENSISTKNKPWDYKKDEHWEIPAVHRRFFLQVPRKEFAVGSDGGAVLGKSFNKALSVSKSSSGSSAKESNIFSLDNAGSKESAASGSSDAASTNTATSLSHSTTNVLKNNWLDIPVSPWVRGTTAGTNNMTKTDPLSESLLTADSSKDSIVGKNSNSDKSVISQGELKGKSNLEDKKTGTESSKKKRWHWIEMRRAADVPAWMSLSALSYRYWLQMAMHDAVPDAMFSDGSSADEMRSTGPASSTKNTNILTSFSRHQAMFGGPELHNIGRINHKVSMLRAFDDIPSHSYNRMVSLSGDGPIGTIGVGENQGSRGVSVVDESVAKSSVPLSRKLLSPSLQNSIVEASEQVYEGVFRPPDGVSSTISSPFPAEQWNKEVEISTINYQKKIGENTDVKPQEVSSSNSISSGQGTCPGRHVIDQTLERYRKAIVTKLKKVFLRGRQILDRKVAELIALDIENDDGTNNLSFSKKRPTGLHKKLYASLISDIEEANDHSATSFINKFLHQEFSSFTANSTPNGGTNHLDDLSVDKIVAASSEEAIFDIDNTIGNIQNNIAITESEEAQLALCVLETFLSQRDRKNRRKRRKQQWDCRQERYSGCFGMDNGETAFGSCAFKSNDEDQIFNMSKNTDSSASLDDVKFFASFFGDKCSNKTSSSSQGRPKRFVSGALDEDIFAEYCRLECGVDSTSTTEDSGQEEILQDAEKVLTSTTEESDCTNFLNRGRRNLAGNLNTKNLRKKKKSRRSLSPLSRHIVLNKVCPVPPGDTWSLIDVNSKHNSFEGNASCSLKNDTLLASADKSINAKKKPENSVGGPFGFRQTCSFIADTAAIGLNGMPKKSDKFIPFSVPRMKIAYALDRKVHEDYTVADQVFSLDKLAYCFRRCSQ